ncbi:I78 family peptidase inhibitor [Pseudooctadecabacter jejudonensis]|uniref:Peptidase inhibitor I78 family protein n=1 Tax=Pseudooctadecabacter jejudonensis TaxID=1391910 RepID=A0A1Y5S2X8_9RHOB|nr:I78 family peptidase inhibitor [Pseudooctadecabacter jejudonensis]SLN30405.1 Peptidase inhibitor I78 family protein [Pseudooctadecabacter jejudonensis]
MKHLILLAPIVGLAACDAPLTKTPPTPPAPPLSADTCNANRHTAVIGQDATALERILIMDEVRVIRPNMAVTQDFRPNRINFNIGPDNRVISIMCG